MDCPRCQLPLRTVDYEGVEVDMCDNCWGFWLDTGELEEILDVKEMQFDATEKATVLSVMTASSRGPRQPVRCLKCSRIMTRIHYDESVRIELDQCKAHGIWLDTGEFKKVQAVASASANIHRMVIRKLGLK